MVDRLVAVTRVESQREGDDSSAPATDRPRKPTKNRERHRSDHDGARERE